jgi:hypothetical protein
MTGIRKLAKVATIGAALFVAHRYMRHRRWTATFSGLLARQESARGYEYQWRRQRSTSANLDPRQLLEMIRFTVDAFPCGHSAPEPIQFSWTMTLHPSLYRQWYDRLRKAAADVLTDAPGIGQRAGRSLATTAATTSPTTVDASSSQHSAAAVSSNTEDADKNDPATAAATVATLSDPIRFDGSLDIDAERLNDVLAAARYRRDVSNYERCGIPRKDPRRKWRKIVDTDEFRRQNAAYTILRQRLAAETDRVRELLKLHDRTHFTGYISDWGVWRPFRAFSSQPV